MLFNLDKKIKLSLLEEYKREALLYREKKHQEKLNKIKEEKKYLEEKNKRNQITLQIIKEEEKLKRKKQMKEYHDMIYNTPKTNKNFLKNEVVTKNWGLSRNQSIPVMHKNNKNKIKNNYTLDYYSLTPAQREKIFVRKNDNMEKYLTDEQNDEEVANFLVMQKNFRLKFYKELLNNQYQELQRQNQEKYGTNDIVIINNKKKNNLYENPFNLYRKYDFGKSNLLNNPIINPENNITYNRYLNLRLNKTNLFDIQNKNSSINQKTVDNNLYNNFLSTKNCDISNKLYQNESINLSDTIWNKENKNKKKKLFLNNYNSFSDDNIFNYKKNINNKKNYINIINDHNKNINIFKTNNNYENNEQLSSKGYVLSQAANSNFFI